MTFMIGQKFPSEHLTAVMPNGNINENFSITEENAGSHTVVFFYPLDFTFVCPTEIVTFNQMLPEFKARNTNVVSVSVDSHFCHAAWRRTPLNDGGIGEVQFPMVSDMERKISHQLGIVAPGGVTYRASYLLDKDGIVRHMVVNDLPLGRNVEEMLRMVDSLQFTEEHGEVCPANWRKGQSGMGANKESTSAYLASIEGGKSKEAA